VENQNNKQDVAIARLEEKFRAFEQRFDNFVSNHFNSLKEEVVWVRRLVIASILIPILLFAISYLLK